MRKPKEPTSVEVVMSTLTLFIGVISALLFASSIFLYIVDHLSFIRMLFYCMSAGLIFIVTMFILYVYEHKN